MDGPTEGVEVDQVQRIKELRAQLATMIAMLVFVSCIMIVFIAMALSLMKERSRVRDTAERWGVSYDALTDRTSERPW